MSKLELILLGRFECLLSTGTRISLPMRKAEVLLAFLALSPGLRHPRERLINLLWSDRGEEQARNSLRQCLSTIRRALGEAADLVLQVDRTSVTLKPELIEVDALEFERLALEGGFESLTTAAELYQGEFLEGISIRDAACQEWLDGERGRFKRQFVEILSNVAETQLVSHDFAGAVRSAEHLVKQDPLGEHGWRLLMRAYADGGDRSHALQAFKRCAQVLADELEVNPEAATLELRERIAAGNARQPPASDTTDTTEPSAAIEPANSSQSPAPETASAPPASTEHSIAVLPFDNLSGDPAQEYFSDGIAESIILNLSRFPGLRVKSRNSSFAFKQQLKGLSEISRELEVDYLVEGSIRKSAERIRITVQLIEAASGNQIWGKRYDAELTDLFELEEELSRQIAATVTGQIESELQRIAIAKGASDQQAYDLLLAGIFHLNKYDPENVSIAVEKLDHCLELDPDNVRAHATLTFCHMMNFMERWSEDHRKSFELAELHALRAHELNPEADYVQTAYAEHLSFSGATREAESCVDRVLQFNRDNGQALAMKAMLQEFHGEFEAALETAELAQRLDPYHPWNLWNVAESQYLCGHYETALETIAKTGNAPGFIRIYNVAANVKLGRIDLARAALQTFLQECRRTMRSMPQSMDEWWQYTLDNGPFIDSNINRDLIDCLVQAGLADEIARAPVRPAGNGHGIVVLPFDNLSGDPAQEYFSDGITESVILNLSLFPGLSVRSRNASFAFKQQLKTPGEISRALGVDYVVEGSIRKSDQRVRVTVQLFDADGGSQVWGKRYDADIEDLFELEEDLSRQIAATVTGQIEADLQRIAVARGAANQRAYDSMLAGLYHMQQASSMDNVLAIEKFNRCLELDPNNATAHACLYYCHEMDVIDRWSNNIAQSRALADEHIQRAISLDPEAPYVHVTYAHHLVFSHRYTEAERQLRKALENNPNDSEAIAVRAVNLSSEGKHEASRETAELALRLDPYHPWARWILAESQFFCGACEDCLATIADTGNAPGFIQIYNVAANVELGRLDAARAALEDYLGYCRDTMLSMPASIDEWLQYYRDNAPFANPSLNERVIGCLVTAGLEEALSPAAPEATATRELPSILVLPFTNLSGDPEQEYFSDGFTESVILSLGSFNGLGVKSRHASFAFKDDTRGIADIATELGAQYIVEGSIRRRGERLGITVQLGETDGGNQLWGKRYDIALVDLIELEEELVQTIAATISGRIDRRIKQVSAAKPAQNLKSTDYLWRGWYHTERFNPDDYAIAIDYVKKCLAIEPSNVEAHAILGATLNVLLTENWTVERDAVRDEAGRHLEKALDLDGTHALAHAYMAEHQALQHDFDKAMLHADKAIEHSPALPDGYNQKAWVLSATGEHDEACKLAEFSLRSDPYHFYMAWNAGLVFRNAGDFRRAVDTFRLLPYPPPSVRAELAAALVGLGAIDEARAEIVHYLALAREQMPRFPNSSEAWRDYWYDVAGYESDADFEAFFELLLQAGLCDRPEAADIPVPAIAVLPFKNISGDSEQEYFSDGITDSIIFGLGLFNGLAVRSRQSSFNYRGSDQSMREIAAELDVQYLVEGSIRKSGEMVHIATQLIETESDSRIWSKQYDAKLEDIFALQQNLSQTIAATISGRIGHKLQQSAARRPAGSPTSYDHLLRGLYHLGRFTADDLKIAREQLEKCIAIDPENTEAHTNLAMVYLTERLENWAPDREQALELSGSHCEQAIKHDPDHARAHAYYAEHLLICRDYDRALFHADKAIELNPAGSEGYAIKASILGCSGLYDEAMKYADRCFRMDPHSAASGWIAGEIYRDCGEYQKALNAFRSIPHIAASVQAEIAACLAGLDRIDEARHEMMRYRQLAHEKMPNYPQTEAEWRAYWRDVVPYKYDKDFNLFFDLLLKSGLCEALNQVEDEMPSIAVLPFENMSGDPEQEHFSDGITADIIDTLSKFKHMRTVSRYSTMAYKSDKPPIATIAEQQKVRYILEGNVRKSGNRVRVNAELIDATSEAICWSERFDREIDDLFAVQDEITQQIVLALKVQLDDGEMALHRSGTTNIKAWELVLTAIDLQDTYIRKKILEARAMAQQAIELDPDYAYAWICLAWTFWQEVFSGWNESFDESMAEATRANQRSQELNPEYSEVWSQAGAIHMMNHEAEQALACCRKAVKLEPGNAETQAVTALAYIFNGKYEQAREHITQTEKLCPVLPNWYYSIASQVEYYTGNLDRALQSLRQGIEVEPDSPLCRFYLVDFLMESGDEAGARHYANEIRSLDRDVSGRGFVRSQSIDPAIRNRFRANLEKFDLY